MDQEITKTCRNIYPIDFKTCSKRKQPRILTRNDKLVSLAFNIFIWAVFFAMASHRPGYGIDFAVSIAIGLEAALITTLTFHSLLVDCRRPQRLAADICRFPQGCGSSDEDVIALANPDVLKLAAKRRCQSEESFGANEALRQSEARTEWAVISTIYGIFALILSGLVWWVVRDITAEHVPLTRAEQFARGEQIDTFMLHLLGYGSLTVIVIAILALCIRAFLKSREANAEETKRERALAALERLPTGYRIAAVQPDHAEESLECRLARIPHHLRSTEIEEYIASVDPAEPGYKTYPTRACGT